MARNRGLAINVNTGMQSLSQSDGCILVICKCVAVSICLLIYLSTNISQHLTITTSGATSGNLRNHQKIHRPQLDDDEEDEEEPSRQVLVPDKEESSEEKELGEEESSEEEELLGKEEMVTETTIDPDLDAAMIIAGLAKSVHAP